MLIPWDNIYRANVDCRYQYYLVSHVQARTLNSRKLVALLNLLCKLFHTQADSNLKCDIVTHLYASQEGRGEILLENSFMRWRCYQGKIMHTTSKTFSVLYVLRKHQQHINIQWHHLRCYFWLIDHPILEQVATPRSFQLEPILDCPVLDVRQLVRNKRRKEYD